MRRILSCLWLLVPALGFAVGAQPGQSARGSHPRSSDSADTTTPSRFYPKPVEDLHSAARTGDGGGITCPETGWYRGDLHLHTNYSSDAADEGGDWVGPLIDIAEYLDDPFFMEAFPEYQDNPLDFIAITDHRNVEASYDPDFRSDKLILIPGEEFGDSGHAGALNIYEAISASPSDGRSYNEQVQWAIEEAKRQGGIFSANHPIANDDMWFWDVEGYEGVEVWTSFWSLLALPLQESVLDGLVSTYGVENRFIRRAIREEGGGLKGQCLAFYEAHLVGGSPLAAVGGSDRHVLTMPAHPTTYIQANEPSSDGLIEGIRSRRTFVSRSPVGPQIVLQARAGSQVYTLGDVIPVGQEIVVNARVVRADQGLLRLITGPLLRDATKEELLEMPNLGEVLVEVPIEGNDFTYETRWTPSQESWIYGMVLELIDYSDQPPEVQDDLYALQWSLEWYGVQFGRLLYAMWPLIDKIPLLDPWRCDSKNWDPYRSVCVDADNRIFGTVHWAEEIDQILNTYREDGAPTDYSMGAITSPMTAEF